MSGLGLSGSWESKTTPWELGRDTGGVFPEGHGLSSLSVVLEGQYQGGQQKLGRQDIG